MADLPTKEQMKLSKDKAALASMKAARENMTIALNRIDSLESALCSLDKLVEDMLTHIPAGSYVYESRESNKERFASTKRKIFEFLNR